MAEQNRGVGLAALVITAFAALGLAGPAMKSPPVVTSPPSTTRSASSNRATHKTQHYEHSAVDLLEDFFDEDPEQVADRRWARRRAETGQPAQNYKILYLIATLPRPDTERLRYQFDDYQNAIEMAANITGFTLDTFDLPWLGASDEDSKSEQLTVVPLRGSRRLDISVKPDQSSKKRTREDPGILLFRNTTQQSLLVILEVGETPTDGVNKIALRNALDQVTWLSGWPVDHPVKPEAPSYLRQGVVEKDPVVWILGPTFSGSATSIKQTIAAWRATFSNEPPQVQIISLAVAIGHNLDDEASERTGRPIRTQIPAEWSFSCVVAGLRSGAARFAQLGQCSPKRSTSSSATIAILREESDFGQQGSLDSGQSQSGLEPITYLPFPVHISDVRTAMERVEATQLPRAPDVSHQDVPVAEENPDQEERDVIPSFSKRSAAYDERILYNLLSTIHQEHFTYVGIIATDVEDLIFLAHQVRQTCPDTILFTSPSINVRYLNSDVNPDLEGMLVFSTYPLFPMTQTWTFPFDWTNLIQFQSNAAEAEYNGMLAYLGAMLPGHLSITDHSSITDHILDYATPFDTLNNVHKTHPVLWISVVGRDEIWPLGFQKVNNSKLEAAREQLFDRTVLNQAADPDMDRTLDSSALSLAVWTSLPFLFVWFGALTGWIRPRTAWITVAAFVVGLALVAWSLWPSESGTGRITLLRVTTLSSGVSPLHPVLFLTFAAIALVLGRGRRIALLHDYPLSHQFLGLENCPSFERIKELADKVADRIECRMAKLPLFWLSLGVYLVGCLLLVVHCRRLFGFSIDGKQFESLVAVTAVVIAAMLLIMVVRAVSIWSPLNRLLKGLYEHPTRAYYGIVRERMLPADSGNRNPVKLFQSHPGYSAVEYCLECARRLVWLGNKYFRQRPQLEDNTIVESVISQQNSLSAAIADVEQKMDAAQPEEVQTAMALLAEEIGTIYGPYWRLKPTPGTFLIGENNQQFNEDGETILAERKAGVIELGGIFVASRVTDLIQHVLSHLMNAAIFATVAAIALMLSFCEYPFPYRDTLLNINWVILLGIAAIIIFIAIEISRDGVLSLLSGTTPGRFNFDSTFIWTVITFGVIPVLAILGAQFPQFFSGIFSWVSSAGGGHPS
jgi:hypothetical protein